MLPALAKIKLPPEPVGKAGAIKELPKQIEDGSMTPGAVLALEALAARAVLGEAACAPALVSLFASAKVFRLSPACTKAASSIGASTICASGLGGRAIFLFPFSWFG